MKGFTESRYYIILGRELLTALGLSIEFSEHVKIGSSVLNEGHLEYMVGVNNYDFITLTDKTMKPQE